MASDLSQLIQDSLSNTLNGLLAKEATIKETTKVHERDLKGTEVLKVESLFDFDNLSSTLTYIVPLFTASHIFNTMMGDIDAETATSIVFLIASTFA